VTQRIDANDPRINDAVVDLAFADNAAYTRDLAMLPDELGVFADAERLCARALHVVSHRIVTKAVAAHVDAAERQLLDAIAAQNGNSRIARKHLGEEFGESYIPNADLVAIVAGAV
jgi:hypothetical protein